MPLTGYDSIEIWARFFRHTPKPGEISVLLPPTAKSVAYACAVRDRIREVLSECEPPIEGIPTFIRAIAHKGDLAVDITPEMEAYYAPNNPRPAVARADAFISKLIRKWETWE
jgi:hypothetical protein